MDRMPQWGPSAENAFRDADKSGSIICHFKQRAKKSPLETLYQRLNRDAAYTGRLMVSIPGLPVTMTGECFSCRCPSSQRTDASVLSFPFVFPKASSVNKCPAGTSHSAPAQQAEAQCWQDSGLFTSGSIAGE